MEILALFLAVGAAAASVYDLLKLMDLEKRIEALETRVAYVESTPVVSGTFVHKSGEN